ncbi:MAG: hypothetical protein AVO35_02745 [Candidatus Aegiribacteria sp. MLS_C]|nr:MAG: hypothetical protein AVO35_02745 [Candidatus Aegiribacteria sp. MLS_C]
MGNGLNMMLVRVFSGLGVAFLVLAVLLVMYNGEISRLESRKYSLLLAGQLVSDWDSMDYPGTGVFDSTAVVGGIRFDIRRMVHEIEPGLMEMRLYIGEDGDWDVELARRFSSFRRL